MSDLVTHLPQVCLVLSGLGLAALGVVVHRDLDRRAREDETSEGSHMPI